MSYDLKVGFACNNNCVHCVITDKINSGNLTFDQIKDIIDNNIQYGEQVVLTGGEPTIRKDFFNIIQYIKEKKNSRIILQTNGRLFHNKEIAKQAVKYIDFFLIAIHSHNKITHDIITEKIGSWDQTIQGIYNLNEYKKNNILHSQTVISKLNVDNLLQTFDFIYNQLSIKEMNMTFPHPNGNAWKNFGLVVPKYSDIKNIIHDCILKYENKLYIEAIPLCYIHPYVGKSIYADGERLLNISKRGHDHSLSTKLIEDYNKLIISEYRKSKTCEQCIYDKQCLGVWKEYAQKYENELDLFPIKENL